MKGLLRQYPFLQEVIGSVPAATQDADFQVKVQRMDEDLMFFKGDSAFDGKYVGRNAKKRQIGTRYVYAFVFDKESVLQEMVMWGRKNTLTRVRDMVLPRSTYYIVIVSAYTWYKYSDQGPTGSPIGRDIEIVIYCLPSFGDVGALLDRADILKNVLLTNTVDLWLSADCGDREAGKAVVALKDLCGYFDEEIYQKGLQGKIEKASGPLSATFGRIRVMTFTSAGRTLITLKWDEEQITFIGAEGEKTRLGVQSANITIPDGKLLIGMLVTQFQKNQLNFLDNFRKANDVWLG